jgi:hypothetical protein
MVYLLKMVIFNSYVSLPEGIVETFMPNGRFIPQNLRGHFQAVLWVPEGDDVVAADADATVAGTAPDAQKRCPFQEDEPNPWGNVGKWFLFLKLMRLNYPSKMEYPSTSPTFMLYDCWNFR